MGIVFSYNLDFAECVFLNSLIQIETSGPNVLSQRHNLNNFEKLPLDDVIITNIGA